MPTLARDQELELVIDSLAYGGRGVARHGELVVFVAQALPGDRVRARVTKFKRRYAEARAVELLEAGPGRVTPRCEHFGVCGGCAWQDLDYAEQLRHKQAQVSDALQRLGRLEGYHLAPIEPARQIWGYRNKFEYSWSQTADGAALGFHVAGRWDRLMAVNTCHIASPVSNELRRGFERWAREQGLKAYDQRSGAGFLRHLVVREGRNTGQLLAMLVTAPGPAPAVDHLQRMLPDGVVGVVHAVNDGVAEVTAGLAQTTLFGADEFEERIDGLTLRLSPGAFMQTNSEMSQVLYRHAIEQARLRPGDVAWDLYCGAGAIGLLAAPYVERVIGIEISSESVARARENAAHKRRRQRRVRGGRRRQAAAPAARAGAPAQRRVRRSASRRPHASGRAARAGAGPRAHQLRLVQPHHACAERTPARGRRLPAGAGATRGHVPPHAPHRMRCAAHPAGAGRGRLTARTPCRISASWATPSAIRGAGREK